MKTYKIIFIGCGKMGGALLNAWAEVLNKKDFLIIEQNKELLNGYKKQGFNCAADIESMPQIKGKVIVFAVKPFALAQAAEKAARLLGKDSVILSVAAGKSVKFIEESLKQKAAVVRVMPNLGAAAGLGVSGLFANAKASKAQKDFCFKLISLTGLAFWVKKEEDLHIITAVSGSSPAYIYNAALTLARAAQSYGLEGEQAQKVAVNVLLGSAVILANSGKTLQEAIDAVATPGGTTEAALKQFNGNDALLKLYKKAMDACIKRSKELGK